MIVILKCAGKNKEDPIKTERARVLTRCSPILALWELSVAMEIRVPIRCGPNLMQRFPHPYDARLHINFDCNRPTGLRDFYV